MAKFSIVIAVYNKEKYIKQTLQSVLNQTCKDFEIVVVNDGSTDASEAVIKNLNDPRIKYYPQQNKGAGAARNTAISKAYSQYIALLDADDYWEETYLEEISLLIKTYPKEHVYATAVQVQTKGKTILSVYSIEGLKDEEVRVVNFFDASHINSLLTSSSTVIKKEVFEEVGMYDPTIKSGQDTDLWVRVALKYNVVFLNKPLATYLFAPSSLSNTRLQVSEKASYEKYEVYESNNLSLKKFLDLNRYSLAILAKLNDDKVSFRKNYEKIDFSNLNPKQRFLVKSPSFIVKTMYNFKVYLEKQGIYLSAFK